MNVEYNKYYELDNSKYYFSVTLQRLVKFQDLLVIKCGSGFCNGGHFGYLIDTRFPDGSDYETEHEIEFCDEDVISEYEKRDFISPYCDFKIFDSGHGVITKGKTSPNIEFAYG